MKKYWFVRKKYGWGWTPSTWQGWLVLGIFLVLVTHSVILNQSLYSENDFPTIFIFDIFIYTILLIGVCFITGEPPKWQWGDKKNDTNKNAK